MKQKHSIEKFVKKVHRRLCFQSICTCVLFFVLCGSILGLGLSILSLFVSFYSVYALSALLLLLAFVIGVLYGIKRTPSMEQAAILADINGNTKETIVTAYMADESNLFLDMVKEKALQEIAEYPIQKRIPIRISWKQWLPCLCSILLLLGSFFIPSPARTHAIKAHTIQKEQKDLKAELEKIKDIAKKSDKLTMEQKQQLSKIVEQAKKELDTADSLKKQKHTLDRLNKKLEQLNQSVSEPSTKDSIQKAREALAAMQKQKEEALAKQAQEALDLALSGSKQEKEDAVQRSQELADLLSNPNLQQAASNYQATNYSQNSYNNFSHALRKAVQEMNQQNPSSQNPNQTASHGNNTNQNTGQNGNTSSPNPSSGNNPSQGNGNGNAPGNGTGNGAGAGNGSGAGMGTNGGQGASGSGWNYGNKDGHETQGSITEHVTIPDGTLGDDGQLLGQSNKNPDSSQFQHSSEANAWAGNKIEYSTVAGAYKERAYKALEEADYPESMKTQIRNYFSQLNE